MTARASVPRNSFDDVIDPVQSKDTNNDQKDRDRKSQEARRDHEK